MPLNIPGIRDVVEELARNRGEDVVANAAASTAGAREPPACPAEARAFSA